MVSIVSPARLNKRSRSTANDRGTYFTRSNLLPRQKHGWGRDELGWIDKVKWNFRKSRVELLVGQLEYVKSDVVLILITQLLGQKTRSYRKGKRNSSKKEQDKEAEDVRRQTTKANNAILQHVNAAKNLSKLQEEADLDISATKQRTSDSALATRASSALTLVSRQSEVVADFQQALMKVVDPRERQALMMEKSPILLQNLLMQWTSVDLKADDQDIKPPDPGPSQAKVDAEAAVQERRPRIWAEMTAAKAQTKATQYQTDLERFRRLTRPGQSESAESEKEMDARDSVRDKEDNQRSKSTETPEPSWIDRYLANSGFNLDCPEWNCDKRKDKGFPTKDLLRIHLERHHGTGLQAAIHPIPNRSALLRQQRVCKTTPKAAYGRIAFLPLGILITQRSSTTAIRAVIIQHLSVSQGLKPIGLLE